MKKSIKFGIICPMLAAIMLIIAAFIKATPPAAFLPKNLAVDALPIAETSESLIVLWNHESDDSDYWNASDVAVNLGEVINLAVVYCNHDTEPHAINSLALSTPDGLEYVKNSSRIICTQHGVNGTANFQQKAIDWTDYSITTQAMFFHDITIAPGEAINFIGQYRIVEPSTKASYPVSIETFASAYLNQASSPIYHTTRQIDIYGVGTKGQIIQTSVLLILGSILLFAVSIALLRDYRKSAE